MGLSILSLVGMFSFIQLLYLGFCHLNSRVFQQILSKVKKVSG